MLEARGALRDIRDRLYINTALCKEVLSLVSQVNPELAKRVEVLCSAGGDNTQRNIETIEALITALSVPDAA